MKNKQLIPYLLFLIFALLISSCASKRPDFYISSEIQEGFILGKGEGASKDAAKTAALKEIAEQIEVRVFSSTEIAMTGNQDESSLLFDYDIKTRTDIALSGVEFLHEEKVGKRWYVMLRYDNRPLEVRILEASRNGEISAISPVNTASFYRALPFYRFLEENKVSKNFMLSHENNVWRVSVGNRAFPLTSRDLSDEFFVEGGQGTIILEQGQHNDSSIIGQPPGNLRAGQEFLLKVIPPIGGFLSLFYVDNSGITIGLLKNQEVREGEVYTYPPIGGLIAETASGFPYSTDMILALFSPQPVQRLLHLESISEYTVDSKNENLYAYGRLLEFIQSDLPTIPWCSAIIRIEEKSRE